MRIFKTKRSFRKEFKRQIKFAIIAAIGFTIAFSWREAVFNSFQNFVGRFLDLPSTHYTTQIYTSIAITLVGVLIIMISSKLLKD